MGGLAKHSGVDWCLRAYPSLSGLASLARADHAPALKRGFECRGPQFKLSIGVEAGFTSDDDA
jgi:hypothetical protein